MSKSLYGYFTNSISIHFWNELYIIKKILMAIQRFAINTVNLYYAITRYFPINLGVYTNNCWIVELYNVIFRDMSKSLLLLEPLDLTGSLMFNFFLNTYFYFQKENFNVHPDYKLGMDFQISFLIALDLVILQR